MSISNKKTDWWLVHRARWQCQAVVHKHKKDWRVGAVNIFRMCNAYDMAMSWAPMMLQLFLMIGYDMLILHIIVAGNKVPKKHLFLWFIYFRCKGCLGDHCPVPYEMHKLHGVVIYAWNIYFYLILWIQPTLLWIQTSSLWILFHKRCKFYCAS